MMRVLQFETYKDAAGEHRWRLVAPNGRIIADGAEGYKSRRNARKAVRRVRDGIPFATLDGDTLTEE